MAATDLDVFEQLGILDRLQPETLQALSRAAETVNLAAGESLFLQGDPSEKFYGIVEGTLAVSIHADEIEADGKQNDDGRKVAVASAGEPVGETQILTGGLRTASVRAETPTRLISLSRTFFSECSDSLLEKNLEALINRRLRHYRLKEMLPRLFGALEEEVIAEIESRDEWVHLSRGEYLCHAGERDQTLYILLTGRLIAAKSGTDGVRRIIGEISAGESVGEMSLFTGEERSADVLAIRDSELVALSADFFKELLGRYPRLAMGITRIIIERLRDAGDGNGPRRVIRNLCLLPLNLALPMSELASSLLEAASRYGSVRLLDAASVDREMGTPGISGIDDDDPAQMRLDAFFSSLDGRYDLVLYQADGTDSQWSRRCLHQADRVLLIADSAGNPVPENSEKALMSGRNIASPGHSLVLFHEASVTVPGDSAEWLSHRNVDFHLHLRRGDAASFRRLARIVSGNAVGLALSGGGAKGYAHAGVLKALEEAGIEVDMIGGTSMGAVIGGGYAMGLPPDEIIRRNKAMMKTHNPFGEYTLPIMSVLGGKRLDAMFREAFGTTMIEDLWRSYFCISSNLTEAVERVHKAGLLWKSVRASMSLPGILPPVIEEGNLLVDGGVVNNLPGDVMKALCPGTVITVDVAPGRDVDSKGHLENLPSPWKVLRSRLNPFLEKIPVPKLLQVMGRTTMLASVASLKKVTSESRYHLVPPVQEFGMLETDEATAIAEVGYRYARNIVSGWDELKA